MRAEFDFELTCQILPLELLVLADIGGDHFLDLLSTEQLADTLVIDPGVIRYKCQTGNTAVANRIQQALGQPAQAETAAGDQDVVFKKTFKRRCSVGIKLFRHEGLHVTGRNGTFSA